LDFSDSRRNRYAYRLKGLNEQWNDVDASNRKVTYTNLKPGQYQYHIWSKQPKELAITVYPAPWLSIWAYGAYLMIFIIAMWGYVRYRTAASRERALALESTVLERTHEVNLQKQMVESLLDHKNELFANVTHEFKTPLSLILGPTDQLLSELNTAPHREKLTMIRRNANRLLVMVGQILKLSQTEQNKKVSRETQNVRAILFMLYESFKPS